MNHFTVGDKSENAQNRRLHRRRTIDGRRLLLEHLETRQLLAGDFLHGLQPLAPFQSQFAPPAAAEISQSATQSPAQSAAQFTGQHNNRANSHGSAGRPQHEVGGSSDGRNSRGNRNSQPDLGSKFRDGSDTFNQTPMISSIASGFVSSLGPAQIGLRMTTPVTLPSLPSGYELVDRFEVAPQNPTLPLSSSPSAQRGFEALIFSDNNSKPPELVVVTVSTGQDLGDTVQTTLEERDAFRGRLPAADSQVNGSGLAADSLTSSAAADAFDEAMTEIFSSDESLATNNADGIAGQMREFVESADPQASVSAFVDSISSELRRTGISEQQIVELENLLQQIVASQGGDDTESTSFDRYQANQLAGHSHSGVVLYDLRDAMMAVPIDDSAIASDPVGSMLETSNAWTQRFGLADVAIVELASFAAGAELARVKVSAQSDRYDHSQWSMRDRFDAAIDTLPSGLVEGVWRPTIAKASLVVIACLAGIRTQQRPVSESKATRRRPK